MFKSSAARQFSERSQTSLAIVSTAVSKHRAAVKRFGDGKINRELFWIMQFFCVAIRGRALVEWIFRGNVLALIFYRASSGLKALAFAAAQIAAETFFTACKIY